MTGCSFDGMCNCTAQQSDKWYFKLSKLIEISPPLTGSHKSFLPFFLDHLREIKLEYEATLPGSEFKVEYILELPNGEQHLYNTAPFKGCGDLY